jgi:hypothetical protein
MCLMLPKIFPLQFLCLETKLDIFRLNIVIRKIYTFDIIFMLRKHYLHIEKKSTLFISKTESYFSFIYTSRSF